MALHARLSASAAHRWLNCAQSAQGQRAPGSASQYAAEGTVAHALAAQCWERGERAEKYIGAIYNQDDMRIEVTREMADAVQIYLAFMERERALGGEIWVEMGLLEPLATVHPDMGGTADFVRYFEPDAFLHVADYKHGSGVFVESEDNWQEIVYAVGAILKVRRPVKRVKLTIVQPRFVGAEPIRSWEFDAWQIIDKIADLVEAAERTYDPNAPFHAGAHCKFCPRSASCPELEKHQRALVAMDFTALPVDPTTLADALRLVAPLKERIRALEQLAYERATAGEPIPGWKLVSKRPTRRWNSTEHVIKWALSHGVNPFESPSLLSPAQLEDRAGGGKKTKEALAPFVESVSSGTALVPDADNREPVKQATASDFDALPVKPLFNF